VASSRIELDELRSELAAAEQVKRQLVLELAELAYGLEPVLAPIEEARGLPCDNSGHHTQPRGPFRPLHGLRAREGSMSASPRPPVPRPAVPLGAIRVEYLGFRDRLEHREFRLRVYGLDGSTELEFRIPMAAFGDGRARLQDGPDVCYQKLLRIMAAGETVGPHGVMIEDDDLAAYREAHAKVQKHRRSWTPPPPSPALVGPPVVRPSRPEAIPPPPAAPLVTGPPALEAGQRVHHAVFGIGVTASSSPDRTVVCFDEHGSKTFITSMLQVDVLSAPHTWEVGPRGKTFLRRTP